MKVSRLISAMVAVAGAVLGGASIQAKELSYSIFLPPGHVNVTDGVQPIIDYAHKAAGLDWKLYTSGQLFDLRGTLAGIRDGAVDSGFIVPSYHAAMLPNTLAVVDTMLLGDDNISVTGATNETLLLECPECVAEFAKQNVVYLGGHAPQPYVLHCRDDVKTLADLKEKKIRSFGGVGRVIQALGGVPVQVPPTESSQAMVRGQLDCTLATINGLDQYSLYDVVKSVVTASLAIPRGNGLMVINRDTWHGLTGKERQAILRGTAKGIAQLLLVAYPKATAESEKKAAARGIHIRAPSADIRAVIAAQRKKEPAITAALWKKRGAKHPEEMIEKFRTNLAKWEKIAADINGDAGKFEQALWDRVYSKIAY